MMRLIASIVFAAFSLSAFAQDAASAQRFAVLIGVNEPMDGIPSLPDAESNIESLALTLSVKAKYTEVKTILGAEATAANVRAALETAVRTTPDNGTILVVLSGRGVGGDVGEAAFLTHGADLSQAMETGLSIEAFATALRPRTAGQSIVVLMDASHHEDVDGMALIGPASSDWPNIPEWGLAITSKPAGVGGPAGVIVPAIEAALAGEADRNLDGVITISELATYVEARSVEKGVGTLERLGAVAANLVMGSSAVQQVPETVVAPVASETMPPSREGASRTRQPLKLRTVPVAVASVGAVVGMVSAGMYLSKMDECEDVGGRTVCGNDDAYRRYRTTQHVLGWTGAGLMAAGVGLQLFAAPDGAMVGVVGSF